MPKTFEGLRSAIRKLIGDNAVLTCGVETYEHIARKDFSRSQYESNYWHAHVKFDDDVQPLFRGLEVTVNRAPTADDCLKQIKQGIRNELERRRSARRLEHQPRRIAGHVG